MKKPKQYSRKYAEIFGDNSVVNAYHNRPHYHPDTFPFLASLIPASAPERAVLDAGCGTGYIARFLAPLVDTIDAVDLAPAMIAMARSLPGGDRPNLHWQVAPIETANLRPHYGLITAAASIHWMDWQVVFPRFARHLAPGAMLALVSERHDDYPWNADLVPIFKKYSQNVDFAPYDLYGALERSGYWRILGAHDTPSMTIRQPIENWIESIHARNGFSRDRMDPETAREADAAFRAAIIPYASDGIVTLSFATRIVWGVPQLSPGLAEAPPAE